MKAILGGGDDPRLALTPERDRAGAVAGRGLGGLVAGDEAADAEADPGAGHARPS